MEPIPTPRSGERQPLSLFVRGRVSQRQLFCDLIDISEGGCKIKAKKNSLRIDDPIIIKIGDIYAPLGTIVWVNGETAGVAFDGQMHAAVIDHLCARHGSKLKGLEADG